MARGGDDPDVLQVKTTAESTYTAGDGWYTDVSCDPAPIQTLVGSLSAVHDGAQPYRQGYGIDPPPGQQYNRTVHPLVIRHPINGRRILWINRGFTTRIEGRSRTEGPHIMEMLFQHMESTLTAQCRVRWQQRTLVIWDNLATQPHAMWDCYPQSRYAERISVVGDTVIAA